MSADRMPPPYPPKPAPEWVGPDGAREDVSGHSDRALILRAVHEVLIMRQDFGAVVRELGEVRKAQRRSGRWQEHADDEITLVRDLRRTLGTWKRRAYGALVAILVIVVGAYVCMKLGLRAP